MKLELDINQDELETLLDAIDAEPNPEGFDFGPAYEFARRAREQLAKKIRAAIKNK